MILGVVAVGLGLGVDVADILAERLLLFLEALDALDEQAQLVGRDGALSHSGLLCAHAGKSSSMMLVPAAASAANAVLLAPAAASLLLAAGCGGSPT
jgi:hypothetical protein